MTRAYLCLALLLTVGLLACLPRPARADGTQIEGITITSGDVAQLTQALHTALREGDTTIPLAVAAKPPSQMPPYDQQWHYAGIQDQHGTHTMIVWIDRDLSGTQAQAAIMASFLLALTDGGYGGAAFKQLYDVYAAKDAQLPANSPDPYVNRHKLASALVDMVQAAAK